MTTSTTYYRNVTKEGNVLRGEKTFGADADQWIGFEASVDLFRIAEAIGRSDEAYKRIWAEQDGYGSRGYTPAQGFDWSGIRDSSVAAVDQMDAVAREYVTDADLAELLGLASWTA